MASIAPVWFLGPPLADTQTNQPLTNYRLIPDASNLSPARQPHESMHKAGLLAEREAHETALLAWIDADAKRKADCGDVLPTLNSLVADRARTRERDALLAKVSSGMGSVMGSAQTIYRISIERAKSDADRDPVFQERNWSRIREAQDQVQRSLEVKADQVPQEPAESELEIKG